MIAAPDYPNLRSWGRDLAIFGDFASRELNRINRLDGAKRGLRRVVPTLGIFWERRVGLIWAHVSAPHHDTQRRQGSSLLASCAQRASLFRSVGAAMAQNVRTQL